MSITSIFRNNGVRYNKRYLVNILVVAFVFTCLGPVQAASSYLYWDNWRLAVAEKKLNKKAELYDESYKWLSKTIRHEAGKSKLRIHEINMVALLCEAETAYCRQGKMGKVFMAQKESRRRMDAFFKKYTNGMGYLKELKNNEQGVYFNVVQDEIEAMSRNGLYTEAFVAYRKLLEDLKILPSQQRAIYECRVITNYANLLWEYGDNVRALEVLNHWSSESNHKPNFIMKLNTIRLRSQVEGPSQEQVTQLKSLLRESEKTQRSSDLQFARSKLGMILSRLDKWGEADKIFDDLLKESKDYESLNASISLNKGQVEKWKKNYASAYHDINKSLYYYRKKGLKVDEFRAYRLLARLERNKKNYDASLKIYNFITNQAKVFRLSYLVPVYLAQTANLLQLKGLELQCWKKWEEVDEWVESNRGIPALRLYEVEMIRLNCFARSGKKVEWLEYFEKMEHRIKNSNLTPYLTQSFQSMTLNLTEVLKTIQVEQPSEVPLGSSTPTYSTQWICDEYTTYGSPSGQKSILIGLYNHTEYMETGGLTFKGLHFEKEIEAQEGINSLVLNEKLNAKSSGPEFKNIWPMKKVYYRLNLKAFPKEKKETFIEWSSENYHQTLKWNLIPSGNSNRTDSEIKLDESPFVPSEIILDLSSYSGVVELKCLSSTSIRSEFYEMDRNLALGTDYESDGKFDGAGDVLFSDENFDGNLDVVLDEEFKSKAIRVWIYRNENSDLKNPNPLSIYIKSEGGPWVTIANVAVTSDRSSR